MIFWVVVIATLFSDLGGDLLLGYRLSGLGWLVPLMVSIYILLTGREKVAMPYWIWAPWAVLVLVYLLFSSAENALQRSIMILTPIVVGMAVSSLKMNEGDIRHIEVIVEKFTFIFWGIVLFKSGIALTGMLPPTTALAPEATTAALCSAFFAARYGVQGDRRSALMWAGCAFAPVIALTRGAIVSTFLTLPFTFAALPLWRRIISLALMVLIGLMVFHTDRFQQKNFHSGSGTVWDMRIDNPDFNTSGRAPMIAAMQNQIEQSPWFGHGANASEQFVGEIVPGITHPHNDWLRLRFDYGYIGVFLFAACVLLQVMHALRTAYAGPAHARLFLLAGSSAFLPFCLLMLTDNVLLYAAFFGNLQFMMLGVGYAHVKLIREQASLKYPLARTNLW